MARICTLLACLTLLPLALAAEDWPQWRGPSGVGVSTETNLPAQWSDKENIAWRLKLPGMGGSTPIIWKDRLFLTSEDGKDIVLLCVSTAGQEVWKRKVGTGAGRKIREDEGNSASASPSTDGTHVFAMCGTGDFAAFDLAGKELWRFNAQERYGRFSIQWGMHTTPLLDGDRLYLQLIHSGGAWVIALDKATGKEVWKVKRESDGYAENEHSYASCVLWRSGEQACLIVHGNDYATGHDLADGKELWRVGGLNPKDSYNRTLRFVASPAAVADLIVVPSAKNGPVVGLRPTARGMVEAGSEYEAWRMPRGTPDVPSPLIHDGLVYLCNERGVLTCVDAKTGKACYSERLHSARYRASPVWADGKVFCTARDGTITVVKAGRTFEQLAENKLPDQIAASPAISGGRIYLRGFQELWVIGAK